VLLDDFWTGRWRTGRSLQGINFESAVRANKINEELLERLPRLGLPDCWLVAGCLFQTIWNLQAHRAPHEHIRDYDVFYYDASDLSYEAEDAHIKRLDAACGDLGVKLELRNQARVHLWYEQRFGHEYPRLSCSIDGIDRFLVACTCVGIRCSQGFPHAAYASFGLEGLYRGVLRPNPLIVREDLFLKKARSYQRRWPWLQIDPTSPPWLHHRGANRVS
jgi:uncharacterized protein